MIDRITISLTVELCIMIQLIYSPTHQYLLSLHILDKVYVGKTTQPRVITRSHAKSVPSLSG